MKVTILTLFPEFFTSAFETSLLGRAKKNNLLELEFVQLRNFAVNKHGKIDDAPYGGGAGMVLMAEPVFHAIHHIESDEKFLKILLTNRGYLFNQQIARQLASKTVPEHLGKNILLICGHYEGTDERISDQVDLSICIGDYILSGGETAALVVTETIVRLLPGFVEKRESIEDESYKQENYLEYPQYTRPSEIDGKTVPDVLLNGNHAEINRWRAEQGKIAFKTFRDSGQSGFSPSKEPGSNKSGKQNK